MRNDDFARIRGRFCCDPGNPIKDVFDPVFNKDGTITLVKTGEINSDDEINSYAESCSIENILARYANGDASALNRYEPLYLDLTEFPTNYIEVMQHAINAERGFDALPVDIKSKYDNNWRLWLSKCGTEEWYKDLGVEPIKSDVKEEKVDGQSEQ